MVVTKKTRLARRGIRLPFLPEEIVGQVILRVQCMKSIVRCMSVCRSWYALIKSRYLVNMHLSHPSKINYLFCQNDGTSHGRANYKHRRANYKGRRHYYYWLHYDNEAFHEYCPVDHPDKDVYQHPHACNGLICYKKANSKRLCLWNPAIRKLKLLPASPQDNDDPFQRCTRQFKLWFDSKANDYRILRIIDYNYKATLVEFYSLKTNSWTLISDNASVTSGGIGRCTYLNGIWYWIEYYAKDGNTLISLDTGNWMFRKVMTWKNPWRGIEFATGTTYLMPIDDRYLVILGIFNLNVFFQGHWCFSVVYDQSSNKFHSIDFRHMRNMIDGWVPIGVRNKAEILLQNYMDPNLEIISWNLEARRINRFVPVCTQKLEQVFPYTESLALLDDADAATI